MKRSVLLSAILLGSVFYNSAKAQISVHIGFNVPARPVYVPAPPPQPVEVYDNDDFDDSDDYYYLPEVEAYYSVPRHCYYYMNSGQWVSAAYLPGAYRNYDWRTFNHYEIRARRPYFNHDVYRSRWGGDFNRGRDWSRRNESYASRPYRVPDRWNGGYNRPGNYGGGWNKPDRNRDNNWGRPNNGNWNRPQPDRNNNGGGWGRGQRPDNNNRGNNGGWGQPRNNNNGGWGGGQPSQPNRGNDDRGNGNRGGGWGQPGRSNDGGERGDRGSRGNGRGFGGQLAQNSGFGGRPSRL